MYGVPRTPTSSFSSTPPQSALGQPAPGRVALIVGRVRGPSAAVSAVPPPTPQAASEDKIHRTRYITDNDNALTNYILSNATATTFDLRQIKRKSGLDNFSSQLLQSFRLKELALNLPSLIPCTPSIKYSQYQEADEPIG